MLHLKSKQLTMKKTIILLVSLSFIITTNAQDVIFDWAEQIGGTGYNTGYSITTDDIGNIYATGFFSGIADFDPGPETHNLTSYGGADIFISKNDTFGNFIWAKQLGGTDYEVGISVVLDNSGNIYITGNFSGTVDFDPGTNTYNLSAMGTRDCFVTKLDPSGNFVWAKQFGGTDSYVTGSSLAIDSSGYVYSIGEYSNTVDFDPGIGVQNLISFGGNDIFISKLDSAGNFIWAKGIGSSDTDRGVDLKVDDSGSDIYCTGEFRGTVDFNPGNGIYNLTSSGSRDIFLLNLSSSGEFDWANKIGDSGADRGHDIAIDNTNNFIYLTGEYSGSPDFNPGPESYVLNSAGGQDCFVTKFNDLGNFVWARSMGGAAEEEPGNSIQLDSNNDVIVTGWFWGISDFDPGVNTFILTSLGQSDVFIAKLDSDGDFSWAKNLGGNGEVYASSWSSALDTSDNIYTTGIFESGTVDFDPGVGTFNLTPLGDGDIFLHKMSNDNLGIQENNFGEYFKIHPNPTSGQLTIDIGKMYSNLTVIVYNQLAQIIQKRTFINTDRLDINIVGSSGIYYVEIKGYNEAPLHFKVLKN